MRTRLRAASLTLLLVSSAGLAGPGCGEESQGGASEPDGLASGLDALEVPDVAPIVGPGVEPDALSGRQPDTQASGPDTTPPRPDLDAEEPGVDAEEPDVDAEEPDAIEPETDTTSPESLCGNSFVDPGEACDDGNTGDGDWCTSSCDALVDASAYESFEGHTSFHALPTSNGLATAIWQGGRLTDLREHPYLAYDEDQPTRDLLWDAYPGVRVGAEGTWLDAVLATEVEYEGGTGLVRVFRTLGDLEITRWWSAPMHHPTSGESQTHLVVGLTRIRNVGAMTLDEVAPYELWNLHLGGEGESDDEQAAWREAGYLVEWRDETVVVYVPLGAGEALYAIDGGGEPHNPWQLLSEGSDLDGFVQATGDDLVAGFQQPAASLGPGQDLWSGVVVGLGVGGTEEALAGATLAFVAGREAQDVLGGELAWWQAWHEVEAPPVGASSEEVALYQQATAILKMGQVREHKGAGCPSGLCSGQLLASMPPGIWAVSWVRDAAYGIRGLVRSGHLPEAREALGFMLEAELKPGAEGGNHYQEVHIESDDPSEGIWGLGAALSDDYAISITRYFGRGLEESDGNEAGPNIEWDNWGLFLDAFAMYVGESGDTEFLSAWWPVVSGRVADLLVDLQDPETGLLLPDSSIWERHWCPHGACDEPETRKRHTYSTLTAARGLHRLAALVELLPEGAEEPGDASPGSPSPTDSAALWTATAEALTAAMLEHLVVALPSTGEPALLGNLEEKPFVGYRLDLAVVEAFAGDLLAPGTPLAFGTLGAFDLHLATGPHSPGYKRNDDPTWYDGQEWVVMDLRAASALARMGQLGRARTLLDWITRQARANHDLIPELLSDGIYQPGSEDDLHGAGTDPGGDVQGATPMVGFGAGAWIEALHDVYAASATTP